MWADLDAAGSWQYSWILANGHWDDDGSWLDREMWPASWGVGSSSSAAWSTGPAASGLWSESGPAGGDWA